jgi:ketosteroid isomerase-like protein
MSQQNVDCLRRAVELGNAGDLDGLAELFHPDVEMRDLQHPPDVPEMLHGREGIISAWERWLDALENWRVDLVEVVDAHPWVVCDMRWRATGRGSTASIDWRLTDAFEVHDGMIVRHIAGFPDILSALLEVEALAQH